MNAQIQFISGIEEKILPVISLTKSKKGKTGTATFIFVKPSIFEQKYCTINEVNGIYLLWEDKKIMGNDISIIFKGGQPFLIKAILIFKNSEEWFNFLQFMNLYSKQTGLSFIDNL